MRRVLRDRPCAAHPGWPPVRPINDLAAGVLTCSLFWLILIIKVVFFL